MDSYRWLVAGHILLGILLVGQALFWAIMLLGLRRKFDVIEAARWLSVTQTARWPHVLVPQRFRQPLAVIAWATLFALLASGLLLIAVTQVPQNAFWWAKLSLLCGLVIAQIALSIRASSTAVLGNFTLVLVVMLVSAWMVRG